MVSGAYESRWHIQAFGFIVNRFQKSASAFVNCVSRDLLVSWWNDFPGSTGHRDKQLPRSSKESKMSGIIRRRVVVSGMVQGVFFRAYTRDAARKIGVTGWVRNLPDGSVEAMLEGTAERVQAMLSWLREGSPMSRVDHVKVHEEQATGQFADFEVTFSRGRYW